MDSDGPPLTDLDALRALAEMWPTLDQWRERFRKPMVPQSGSLLDVDDRAWPRAPLSTIAASKLAIAVDHLQAGRVLVEAQSLHPAATFTLARSALLCSSQALWLLGPNEPALRQRRGIYAVQEGDEEHSRFLRDVLQVPGALPDEIARVQAVLAERATDAVAAAEATGVRPGGTSGMDVIRWAAQFMQPHNPDWALQAAWMWRAGSAAAHGHQYGLPSRPTRLEADSLLIEQQAGGDVVLTWQYTYVPFMTVMRALARWDQLAER